MEQIEIAMFSESFDYGEDVKKALLAASDFR